MNLKVNGNLPSLENKRVMVPSHPPPLTSAVLRNTTGIHASFYCHPMIWTGCKTAQLFHEQPCFMWNDVKQTLKKKISLSTAASIQGVSIGSFQLFGGKSAGVLELRCVTPPWLLTASVWTFWGLLTPQWHLGISSLSYHLKCSISRSSQRLCCL